MDYILTNFVAQNVAFQNDKGDKGRFLLAQDSDRGEVLCLREKGGESARSLQKRC